MGMKWQHDGVDAAETWWLGPDGCDSSEALATVSPSWGVTRAHGQGRPDEWVARDASGKRIGKFKTRREAAKAAEEVVVPPSKRKPSKKSAKLDREITDELAASAKSAPRFNADVVEDQRPGFYYVTALDGGRSARIAGPYKSHGAALDKVGPVKTLAEDVDPRAIWWAWGTMRSETDLGPGALGVK